MRTGETRIYRALGGGRYIVEVKNCRNLDDDGTILSSFDTAYYEICAADEAEALREVMAGAGEFCSPEFLD